MKRFFVGLVLLHALSWGEQAVYAQVLDMVNSKYTFGPITGFTAALSLLLVMVLRMICSWVSLGKQPWENCIFAGEKNRSWLSKF